MSRLSSAQSPRESYAPLVLVAVSRSSRCWNVLVRSSWPHQTGHMFTSQIPLNVLAIARPDGIFVMLESSMLSLATIAVPRCDVPTRSVSKVMRMIFSIYWTYMQLQFIPFKVGSLQSNATIPAFLSLFRAVEEVFTWDVVQSLRRSCLNVFNCPKIMSFEVGFELGE